MLRDNRAGSSHRCLENPRPTGAEPSLTEDVTSPFQAEPRQDERMCLLEFRDAPQQSQAAMQVHAREIFASHAYR
jgi:hypothetical protein